MKIYRVYDEGTFVDSCIDLAELGKWFLKLSKKYPKSDWYWVDEDII